MNRIILEAHNVSEGGSEGLTGLAWLQAAVASQNIEKIFLFTADMPPSDYLKDKVEVIRISRSKILQRMEHYGKNSHNPAAKFIGMIAQRFSYVLWLHRSASAIRKIVQKEPIPLAVHTTWTNLLFGTAMRQGTLGMTKIALVGSIPTPIATGFNPFLPISERLAYFLLPLLRTLSSWRRKTDFLVVGSSGMRDYLAIEKPRTKIEVMCDPFIPLNKVQAEAKTWQAIYVDTPNTPRKGRAILRQCLQRTITEPLRLPIVILSSDSMYWQNLPSNVHVQHWLSPRAFEQLLSESSFVINTSWREGLSTTISRAASSGGVPILPDIAAFETMAEDAAIKYKCDGDITNLLIAALRTAEKLNPTEIAQRSLRCYEWSKKIVREGNVSFFLDKWLKS